MIQFQRFARAIRQRWKRQRECPALQPFGQYPESIAIPHQHLQSPPITTDGMRSPKAAFAAKVSDWARASAAEISARPVSAALSDASSAGALEEAAVQIWPEVKIFSFQFFFPYFLALFTLSFIILNYGWASMHLLWMQWLV